MLTMNRATLVGHAGRNPEMRTLPSGDEVALFSLATTERFKRRDGSDGEATEWHAIVAFGAAAEAVRKLVRRGDPVLVEGRIGTRTWTDRKGAEHRTSEIVVAGPRGQVNVLAKRRREPDGHDEPPGGAAPAGAAKAADAERNEETADAVAAAAFDRTADTGTGEDAGPGSEGDAAAGADTDGRAEPSVADGAAGGTSNGDSPKGSVDDAGSGSEGDGAAGTGGANTVQRNGADSGAHEDTRHGAGHADTAGPPEDAAAAEAASAGTEGDAAAAADTTGRTEACEADRAAGGTSGGDSPYGSDADAGTGEAEGKDGGGAVVAGADGRPGDTGHE